MNIPRRMKKAVDRGETSQSRHGQCLNCGGNWDDCPCTRVEVDQKMSDAALAKRLGLPVNGK